MDDYQSYGYMLYHPSPQHQQLPLLAFQPMDQPIWPSMLTGGASQPPPSYQTTILPAVPVQTPISAISTTSEATPTRPIKRSSSRRKLTDDERRKICIEAATNPDMSQTKIGLEFRVHRTTVSKILGQRDRLIELDLINWVRNKERKGIAVTDDELKNQALFFSSTYGNSDDKNQYTSDAWLSSFKQKHPLSTVTSSTTSYTDGQLDRSSVSDASRLRSPALSLEEDDLHRDVKNGNDDFVDFRDRHVGSTTDLGEVISPDLEPGGVIITSLSRETQRSSTVAATTTGVKESSPGYASAYSRQRSQAFPHCNSEEPAGSRPNSSGRHTPLPVRSVTTSVAPQDLHVNPREMMKRSESVPNIRDSSAIYISSMKPPPLPKSERKSPVSLGSPTQEEARRALHTLKTFFQAQPPDTLDMDDWTSIGNMMRKLRLPHSSDKNMPGGMVPLDNLEDPRPLKKRTILLIST